MSKYFNLEDVYDKKTIKKALKVLEYGDSNKWKYVEAKDLICRLAQIYINDGLVKINENNYSCGCPYELP